MSNLNKDVKNVYIVDDCTSSVAPINESSEFEHYTKLFKPRHDNKLTYLGGKFTELGVRNRNDRVYTYENFNPFVTKIVSEISKGIPIWGEFDHPDVFDTSLKTVSHVVMDLRINETRDTVNGVLRLINNTWGNQAKNIIEDGFPLFVSSRAAGTTTNDGVVALKELFTYDMVGKPGFPSAKVDTINESCGFKKDSNFRIYDLTNITDQNKFYIMEENQKEAVTLEHISKYIETIVNEQNTMKEILNNIVKNVKVDKINENDTNTIIEFQNKIEQLEGELENLTKFAQQMSLKNEKLEKSVDVIKSKNEKLTHAFVGFSKHSDTIVKTINEAIDEIQETKAVSEKTVEFIDELNTKMLINEKYLTEEVAPTLDKAISFVENISENVDSTRKYVIYNAKVLDCIVESNDYIIENMEVNHKFQDYLTLYVDGLISMIEENANHLNSTIGFVEYTAKETQTNQAYSLYAMDQFDKLVESLKSNVSINESESFKAFENFKNTVDVSKYYDAVNEEEMQFNGMSVQNTEKLEPIVIDNNQSQDDDDAIEGQTQIQTQTQTEEGENVQFTQNNDVEDLQSQSTEDKPQTQTVSTGFNVGDSVAIEINGEKTIGIVATHLPEEKLVIVKLENGEESEFNESVVRKLNIKDDYKVIVEKSLNNAKKQKAGEEFQPEFISVLTESNKRKWYSLPKENRDKVVLAVNESKAILYTESDVMSFIQNTLTVKKTNDEILLENLPSELKPTWNLFSDNKKAEILTEANWFPQIFSNNKLVENFWITRNLNGRVENSDNKVLINEGVKSNEISEDESNNFMNEYKRINGIG